MDDPLEDRPWCSRPSLKGGEKKHGWTARIISRPGPDGFEAEPFRTREWLVTNGLGGYASGTVLGVTTRRYHGILIAAMPAPLGAHSHAQPPDGASPPKTGPRSTFPPGDLFASRLSGIDPHLRSSAWKRGLPVWRYEIGEIVIEKRIILPHHQNTTHVSYRVVSGPQRIRLQLRPAVHFRPHDAAGERGP